MPNSLIINHFYGPSSDTFSIRSSTDISLFQDYNNPLSGTSAEPIVRDDTGFYFVYNGLGRGSNIIYKYDSNLNATPLWTLAVGSEFSLGTIVYSGKACISGNYIYVFIAWLNGIVVQGYRIYMVDKTTGSLVYSRTTRDSSGCDELFILNGVLYNSYWTGACRNRGYSLVDLTDVGPVIVVATTNSVRNFAVVNTNEVWGTGQSLNSVWKYDGSFVLQNTYSIADINVNSPDYDYIASIRYVDSYIFVLGWKSLANEGKVYKIDPADGSVLVSSLVDYAFDFEVFSPPIPAITKSSCQVIW